MTNQQHKCDFCDHQATVYFELRWLYETHIREALKGRLFDKVRVTEFVTKSGDPLPDRPIELRDLSK